MLVAFGIAVVIGAALLWPSRQKVDIPLPMQNAAGGAVTTEAGHVVSSEIGTCGSPSVGQVLTADPLPAPVGGAPCRLGLIAIDSGPNTGAKTLLEFSAGPDQPERRQASTFELSGRSTRRAAPATGSTTTSGRGR